MDSQSKIENEQKENALNQDEKFPKIFWGSGQKTSFDRTEQIVFKIYSTFIIVGMLMTLLSLFYGFELGLVSIYAILVLFIYIIREVRKLYEKQQIIIGQNTFEQILGTDFYSYNYDSIEELSIHNYFGSEDVAFIIFKHPFGHRLLLRMDNMNQLAKELVNKIGEKKIKKIESILPIFFLSQTPTWSIPFFASICILSFYFAHHFELRMDFLVSMILLLTISIASYSYLGLSWGRRIQAKVLWIFPLIFFYTGDLAYKNHEINMCKVSFKESCYKYTYFYGDTLFTDSKQKEHDQMEILRLGCGKNHSQSCLELGLRLEETGPTTALKHFEKSCELNMAEGCLHTARLLVNSKDMNEAIVYLELALKLGLKNLWALEEGPEFAELIKNEKVATLIQKYKNDPNRVPASVQEKK